MLIWQASYAFGKEHWHEDIFYFKFCENEIRELSSGLQLNNTDKSADFINI